MRRTTRAAIVGAGITLFWVIMMASLLKDQVFKSKGAEAEEYVSPPELLKNWQDYEEWMQVFLNDQPIGIFNAAVKREDAARHYTASFRLFIALKIGLAKSLLRWEGLATMDRNFTLQRFYLAADLGFSTLHILGIADGKEILYKIARGSEAAYGAIRIKTAPSLLDAATDLLLRKVDLKVGRTFKVRAFDPIWRFGAGDVEIRITATEPVRLDNKQINTYKVETQLMNVKTTSWVAESGQTVKRELIEGITMLLVPKSKAIELFPELKNELRFPEINLKELRSHAQGAARTTGIVESLQNLVGSK
jgi:hypothetical protein